MNFIKGNQNPVIGVTTFFEVVDLGVALNFTTPNNLQYVWYIYKKGKNGSWENITENDGKTGTKVPYKFGDIAIDVPFKLEVHKAVRNILTKKFDVTNFASLEIIPTSNKNYSIQKVVLFNNGAKDPNKATYKDSLIARAYCVAMFNKEVNFQLWEDDAARKGHNPEINKNNKLPQIFKARVNTKGFAEVKISLLSNEKILRSIADKYLSAGDKNEGTNHEYYVTASYAGKIQGASQVNVNVATSGAQQPKDSAIFPGTSNQPAKPDKEGKVTHAYFIDSKGNPTQNIKVGDSVKIRIKTINMIGEYIQYIVWEKDYIDTSNDDIFRSPKIKIIANAIDTHEITITQEKYNEGIDYKWESINDEDKKQQQYFIEIIPLNSKAKSANFGIDDESKRTKVENVRTATTVNNPEGPKINSTCICKEQYKDLIWGGKVSCEFRQKVVKICEELWKGRGFEMASGLMAVMKVETNGTFKAHQIMGKPLQDLNTMKKDDFSLIKKNGEESSRAVGLIQFTQPALELMGEFVGGSGFDKLHEVKLNFAKMGEIKQLDKVKKYFSLQPKYNKLKNTPEDIYLLVFGPEGVGKDDSKILYRENVDAEKYRQNASVDLNRTDGNNDTITRGEILTRYHDSVKEGKGNKTSKFICANDNVATVENTIQTGYFIYLDGSIKYIETSESINYFVQVKLNSNEFKKIATLTKNSFGMVKFPDSGGGFNRYGTIDKGGQSSKENVGQGDHYLLPKSAAALFGLVNEINAAGWEIHLGDMSTENGSDPWQAGFKHHAGHGHLGSRKGIDIDFRYLNKAGTSFKGVNTSASFDKSKNDTVFKLAYKYGFRKNYATGMTDYKKHGVSPTVGEHYDHGHFGLSDINLQTVTTLNIKIAK